MTEMMLSRAETLSGNLQAERLYAANHGIRCITE